LIQKTFAFSIMKKIALLGFVALTASLTSCGSGEKAADTTTATTTEAPAATAAADTTSQLATPAHTQLVADHQKMEEDHRTMATADSVMEADHQQEVAAAKAAGKTTTPAFAALEKRHNDIITRHKQVVAMHDEILKRHAELEQKHAAGGMTDAQMLTDHEQMKAEDQKMQDEHQKLVADHKKIEEDHAALLKK
jgi:hypothetical protein